MRLETQKSIDPRVKELCALHTEAEIARNNLQTTAAKIKTLESELATISGTESMNRLISISVQDRKSREICYKFRAKISYYLNNRQNTIIRKFAHALFPTSRDMQRKYLQEILKKNPTFQSTNLQLIEEEVCPPNWAIQDKTPGVKPSSISEQINVLSQKRASPEKWRKPSSSTSKKFKAEEAHFVDGF
jgi:hypothetical protein